MATMLKKKQFWGILIAIALLAYCVKDISGEQLRSLAGRVNLVYMMPAALLSFSFVIIKAFRWRLIVSPQKAIPIIRSVTLYSAGQILNVLMPALTGQVGRMFLFSKKCDLRKSFVFSTFVLEVLFDAISLVVLLLATSLAFAFPSQYRAVSYVIGSATVAALIFLYLILQYQQRMEHIGRKYWRDRWPGFYISLKKFMRSFTKGIKLLKSSQHLFGSLVLSILYWGSHILVVYCLFKAFGFSELPIAAAATVMIVNTIALMVPITPGNAGTFEVAVSASLAAFPSVGRADAVMFALALHLLDLLPPYIMGMFFLRSEKVSIREIQTEHAEEDVLEHLAEDGSLIEREDPV